MIELDERIGVEPKIIKTVKDKDKDEEIERLKKENKELKEILQAYKQMLK